MNFDKFFYFYKGMNQYIPHSLASIDYKLKIEPPRQSEIFTIS